VLATIEEPAKGPAADQGADQGVRPTNYAGVRPWKASAAAVERAPARCGEFSKVFKKVAHFHDVFAQF
jgi:hypothetical protein